MAVRPRLSTFRQVNKVNATILIVDDDDFVLLSMKLMLEQQYREVVTTSDPNRIPALSQQYNPSLILLDMNFRQGDTSSNEGLFWLRQILKQGEDTQVILMTAYGEIQLAVEAIKEGAFDFIVKPWDNDKIQTTIANAISLGREKKEVRQLKSKQKTLASAINSHYPELIGESAAIEEIKNAIEKLGNTDADILILGENGTGKEVIARNLHRQSNRSSEVFISVDVGSLSESIFESELFGHKKGAFTDAKEDRVGRIEAASGGTLFLDEIGNLPLGLQSKLLTFLQHKKITRIGTNTEIDVNVRVICATNCNLSQLVKEKKFREDLYFRINTVELVAPPLRERPADVPVLANHYLRLFSNKYQKKVDVINDEAIDYLQHYAWPGNVRELQHAVERAIIMSEKEQLTVADFKFLSGENDRAASFDNYNLENVEAWAIKRAIKKHEGNISHAAKELGLSRGALYRRLERYGI
ncbi:MAG: sigma-54-dependent Fis family transcriptional regulator [Cyclobacteriaceae bacterium]|nr:sigma-54-dependent Fis family transcriptional regulator [Cyclobacteriaceae bacterium]